MEASRIDLAPTLALWTPESLPQELDRRRNEPACHRRPPVDLLSPEPEVPREGRLEVRNVGWRVSVPVCVIDAIGNVDAIPEMRKTLDVIWVHHGPLALRVDKDVGASRMIPYVPTDGWLGQADFDVGTVGRHYEGGDEERLATRLSLPGVGEAEQLSILEPAVRAPVHQMLLQAREDGGEVVTLEEGGASAGEGDAVLRL